MGGRPKGPKQQKHPDIPNGPKQSYGEPLNGSHKVKNRNHSRNKINVEHDM